jgi:Tfp pilus assembly protein PilF/predicted O-methyltransferase YrrM
LLASAFRAHKKGRRDEAVALYEQRLGEAPDCLDAWMNLGALWALRGDAEQAESTFRRAAELAPRDGRVLRDIALGLFTIGRLARAAEALERSVACQPDLVGSWLHLARVRLEVCDRSLAIAAAERARSLAPDDASAHFLLARCLFDAADPGPSLRALERAHQTGQRYPEAEILHRLLVEHCAVGQAPTAGAPRDFTTLESRYPHLAALVDAARYVRDAMPNALISSSARDTLRLAEARAPREGSVVELGVFHGVSLRWLAEWRPGDVHGFDSFEGLPSAWQLVPCGRFTTGGRTPRDVGASLWVGSFEQQLPRFVEQHPRAIALLHVDSDLYESASSGLRWLAPLLRPGSVVVFDEYLGHHSWRQDEFRAFQEAVHANGWSYEYLAVNPFVGQAVVRLLNG